MPIPGILYVLMLFARTDRGGLATLNSAASSESTVNLLPSHILLVTGKGRRNINTCLQVSEVITMGSRFRPATGNACSDAE